MVTENLPAQWGRRRWQGRLVLMLLILVFALPLGIATWLYQHPQVWTPTTFTNHGELLDPPRRLEPVSLVEDAGEPFGEDELRGHWTLLHVGESRCDSACEEALVNTRQLRLALGHDIDRVQRVYLSTVPSDLGDLSRLSEGHPRLRLVAGGREALEPIMAVLGQNATGRVYLLDPLGNVVLRYDPGVEARGMLKDLEKLLRNSRIG